MDLFEILNVPGLLASVIVGMGSAYLTAQKVLAEHRVRLETLEQLVSRIDLDSRGGTERLVRLETKLDMLLDRGPRRPYGKSDD
jgi:hypothetical protein